MEKITTKDVVFINPCSICGEVKEVQKKYYHYEIFCDCCIGDHHFETVWYCEDCKPVPPLEIRASIESVEEAEEKYNKRENIPY